MPQIHDYMHTTIENTLEHTEDQLNKKENTMVYRCLILQFQIIIKQAAKSVLTIGKNNYSSFNNGNILKLLITA